MERQAATQQQKYVAFKTAFESISRFRKNQNFIGAYVVAFSVIEDRLRAMFVVRYIADNSMQPTDRKINGKFSELVRILKNSGDIEFDLSTKLLDEARERNRLLHASMWNIDSFTDEAVVRVIGLARKIDLSRGRQKKLIKS